MARGRKKIEFVFPSNPEDQKKLKGAIKEIEDSMTRISSEQQLIQSIKKRWKEELGVPGKFLKEQADILFKKNRETLETETEEKLAVHDILFKKKEEQ